MDEAPAVQTGVGGVLFYGVMSPCICERPQRVVREEARGMAATRTLQVERQEQVQKAPGGRGLGPREMAGGSAE